MTTAQYGVCTHRREGNCWDNALVERFFSSLKREWTGDEGRMVITPFITVVKSRGHAAASI
jgi:transposase InsO family protein